MPLDGIWMRAPYLHNGSVPTIEALLVSPKNRPVKFKRGCDTFDSKAIGFTCSEGFEFDTSLKGNSNSGHDYGTSLSIEDKTVLIEYIKSL